VKRNQSSIIDGESARGTERLGFFAHELRNLLNTAMMAFEVLKTGNVGVTGSTGTVLQRSLMAAHALMARSLAEVRLTQGIQNRERFLMAEFVEDIASASPLEADARGVRLTVTPVEDGLAIDADRQVLAAVVGNLLQNSFKFTRPRTNVTLRVHASAERVLIEVQDECGGLPNGSVDELFRPFEQRSADRTGVGLGLAFSRWGTEANDGLLYARDIPSHGCVFTVDLPRRPVPAVEAVPS
jgi:signal transduction histidine kinase